MIRISIHATETEKYAGIGPRLRNAALVADSEDCDACVIPVDISARDSLIQQAVQSGKHVMIELPLTQTKADAEVILQACRTAGVKLTVANAKRFLPSVRTVKDVLDSRKLGDLGLLRIHRWDDRSAKCQSIARRLTCEIDLAVWLFGKMPTEIYSAGNAHDDDYVQVHLGFPNGGMALIDLAVLPSTAPYYSLSLIGSTGAAYADDHHNLQLIYREDVPMAVPTSQGDLHLLAQLQNFVDMISNDAEACVSPDEALTALQITEAAVESLGTRRAARLAKDYYEFI